MSVRRVALVGLGAAAESLHLPGLRECAGVELVGAADPAPRARDVAKRWGIPLVTDGVDELLVTTRPDLVVVVSPPALHAAHATAALRAGAHVLCEKPFVPSIDEADALVALARQAGRLLAVNNQYRHMAIYEAAARALAPDDLGPPIAAQVWQQMLHPPSRESNWRAALPRYTLFEFATHPLDLLSVFFGGLPVAVTAVLPPVTGEALDVVALLLLEMPDGRGATLTINRASHAPERYLEMRVDTARASLRLSFGGLARLTLDTARGRRLPRLRASLVKGGEARVESGGRSRLLARAMAPEQGPATARHLRAILTRLDAGDVAPSAAEHARELLRVVLAAYRSAARGERVRVADVGPGSSLESP